MGSERFYIAQPPQGRVVRLPREESHHLSRVRRVRVGDEVVLFDGTGVDYAGRVAGVDSSAVEVEILRSGRPGREAPVAVTLAVAVVKQSAMDALVDTCTQLGMARLIPVHAARTVVNADAARSQRWRRIAVEACKQCGRSVLPAIDEVRALVDALGGAKAAEVAVVGSTRPDAAPLAEALARPVASAFCLIGPEGGWTDDEEAAAIAAGCVPVSLGRSVLRTETAAAAALTILTQGATPDGQYSRTGT